ncbi:MAG: serine/threonine protein kinase, partial [Oligoflexia bacterium]|nr:serine/threonine protein kinase [Oligoflexia bacterium]
MSRASTLPGMCIVARRPSLSTMAFGASTLDLAATQPAFAVTPIRDDVDETVLPDDVDGVGKKRLFPLLADRYRTRECLGTGSSSRVYRAIDRLTGDQVAIKVIHAPTTRELDRIRSEVTAMRWLRLPGVAALRDDGLQDDEYFVVMDLISGRPFLGPRRREWAEIVPSVLALLDTLARVHLAGVVHRDIKPANVLVDRAGQPIIVDFGLARGQSLTTTWDRSGTPRYVAPEQARGLPCGPQADLYSIGVMLYEALSGGFLPQERTRPSSLLVDRRKAPPRPLARVAPGVPASVSAVVDRLVSPRPEDRPSSAWEVIQALGGQPPVALDHTLAQVLAGCDTVGQGTVGQGTVGQDALGQLFQGPDVFLHLRKDAASVLWQRTGGLPELVALEVRAWVQAGLCTWEGARLRIDRIDIEALRVGLALAVDQPI